MDGNNCAYHAISSASGTGRPFDPMIALVLWWSTGREEELLFDQKGLKKRKKRMRMKIQYQRSDMIITSITSKTVRMLGFHYWRPIWKIIAGIRQGEEIGVAEGGAVISSY